MSPLFLASTQPPESPDLDTSNPLPPWSDDPSESLLSPGPDDGSGSNRRSTGSGFKVRELREAARGAVRTVGGAMNRLLTRRHSPERHVGLFLPDEDDEKAMGDPIASLASRRLPDGAKNADTVDLIRLALGVLGYLTKQAERKVEAEEIRLSNYVPPDLDDPDQPDPDPEDPS